MAQLLDIRSSDLGPRDFLVKWSDKEEDAWVRSCAAARCLGVSYVAPMRFAADEVVSQLRLPELVATVCYKAACKVTCMSVLQQRLAWAAAARCKVSGTSRAS